MPYRSMQSPSFANICTRNSLSLSFFFSLCAFEKLLVPNLPLRLQVELDSIQQVLTKIPYDFFQPFVAIKRSEITR